MRKIYSVGNALVLPLMMFFCFYAKLSYSQSNQKTQIRPNLLQNNIEDYLFNKNKFNKNTYNNHYYTFIKFQAPPSKKLQDRLQNLNIQLLQYHQHNIYSASIPKQLTRATLNALKITAIQPIDKQFKLSNAVQEKLDKPSNYIHKQLDITIVFFDNILNSRIKEIISDYDINIEYDHLKNGKMISGAIAFDKINLLLELPEVAFLDITDEEPEPLYIQRKATTGNRINVLTSNFAGSRNLSGDGVIVGLGDGGELSNHIDFKGRIINYANGTYSSYGAHGDLSAGIIAGNGNIVEDYQGCLTDVQLITQKTSRIINYAADYINDHGMVITSNSYGSSITCGNEGSYNYSSQLLDWQMINYSNIVHVFAGGNAGTWDCGIYPVGYNSIMRAYSSAKNVLTVGNVDYNGVVSTYSARGPVADGRLKPEIVSYGQSIISTNRDDWYEQFGGTSAATPAVSATLALIYERYRQLYGGANPKGALVKALACNTANDLGNPGPDFIYGFGGINARQAIESLESDDHYEDEITQGENKQHILSVPAGITKLNVMLYWNDKEAEAYPVKALINDLDITITDPNGNIINPWILDHTPTGVTNNAVRGVDTLNNIEQITIDSPMAGNYTININGSSIPVGSQQYVVTTSKIEEALKLTYPIGGEVFHPNGSVVLRWDAYDNDNEGFKLEYSPDGGSNWVLIKDNYSGSTRHYRWNAPSILSDDVLVRVSRNGNASQSESPFNVLWTPKNFSTKAMCNGDILLEWSSLDYATEYEVFQLGEREMEPIGITSDTSYFVENLTLGEEYWFAVRAKTVNGRYSYRCRALRDTSKNTDICYNGNLELSQIVTPLIGREATSTALSNSEAIAIKIVNKGTITLNHTPISYVLDGIMYQDTCNIPIPEGDSVVHIFQQTADLSVARTYNFDTWLEHKYDNDFSKDSLLEQTIVHLENIPISVPFLLDFENVTPQTHTEESIGIADLDCLDYEKVGTGVLEVSTNPGILPTDNNFLSLSPSSDADTNEAIFTFNLSNISLMNLILQFKYDHFTQDDSNVDRVWIRGSDTDPWVELYEIPKTSGWIQAPNLFTTAILNSVGQTQTSSFQVKFVQSGSDELRLDDIMLIDAAELPVELVYFTAQKTANDVLLKWETASELNNDFFEVQVARSEEDFAKNNFEIIGIVNGNGTTSVTQSYYFADTEKFKHGVRYYRLKQVDFDGAFEYSPILPVHFEKVKITTRVYPNPFAQNEVFLYFDETEEKILDIKILNNRGFVIKTFNQPIPAGQTTFRISFEEDLPSGFYYINGMFGKERFARKLIKERS